MSRRDWLEALEGLGLSEIEALYVFHDRLAPLNDGARHLVFERIQMERFGTAAFASCRECGSPERVSG